MPYEPHFTITSDLLSVVEEIAALRKKIYQSVDELQDDLDEWLVKYNTQRTHQGKVCQGRTPMETLIDGKQIWKAKFLN